MGVGEMKDLKINKGLIKNVLVKETENLSDDFSFYIDEDYIVFRDEGETLFDYTIYKFAFKCKEWAFKNKYKIQSQINEGNKGHSHITKKNDDCWAKGFFENTEIEAIIKACEWILKNKAND